MCVAQLDGEILSLKVIPKNVAFWSKQVRIASMCINDACFKYGGHASILNQPYYVSFKDGVQVRCKCVRLSMFNFGNCICLLKVR